MNLLLVVMALLCYNITVEAAEAGDYDMSVAYGEEELEPYALSDIKEIRVEQIGGGPYIPNNPFSGNLVKNAEVVYRLKYRVTAKKLNGAPATNVQITAHYPSAVAGVKVSNINSSGNGFVEVDVRGSNSFTLYCMANGVRSNQISYRPGVSADYQNSFYCTAYIVALESDYRGSSVYAPGITDATFKSAFISAVKLNGTGKAESGRYIHWNGSGFSYITKPTTATGTEATVGRTIAVDPEYIPRAMVGGRWKRATVNIDKVGICVAEDGGGDIKGYRIDIYKGLGESAASGWNNEYKKVRLISVN